MDWIMALALAILYAAPALAQDTATFRVDPAVLGTYIWLAAFGALGGLVSFYQKVKRGVARWLNINELIGELFTSGFTGTVAGLLCQAAGLSAALTFAVVGISGHLGGRGIFWLEKAGQQYLEKRYGIKVEDPEATKPGGQ